MKDGAKRWAKRVPGGGLQIGLFDARPSRRSRLRCGWLRLDDAFVSKSKSGSRDSNGDSFVTPGRDVVTDILWRQRGIVAVEVGPDDLGRVDVALVPMTSAMDVYALTKTMASRGLTARSAPCAIVVGGQGALNLRVCRDYWTYQVLGRAEHTLAALIDHIEHGTPVLPDSVIDSLTMSDRPDSYTIAQSSGPYPFVVSGGQETMLGCQYSCSFCQYSAVRRPTKRLPYGPAVAIPGKIDSVLGDVDWAESPSFTSSIDGVSQRVRRAVRKPVSSTTIARVLGAMRQCGRAQATLKLHVVLGFPTETEGERVGLLVDLERALSVAGETMCHVLLARLPFCPDTFTACQYEGIDTSREWRKWGADRVTGPAGEVASGDGWRLYVPEVSGGSTWQQVRRLLVLRGTEEDADIVRSIALNEDPWRRLRAQECVEHFAATYPRAQRIVGRREIGDRAEWGYIRAPRGWDYIDREAARLRRMLGEV